MDATEVSRLVELETHHWWYRERRHVLATLVRDKLAPDGQSRIALDVGAAGGGNTRVLRDADMMAVAVEFEPGGAAAAHKRGLATLHADARSLPVADCSVDLVVAFDVLEHIEEDAQVVSEVERVLSPGGWLFVAVPADMKLWSAHDLAVGHVRRYDRAGLGRLIRDSGLRLEEIWSWNVLVRPVVARRRRSLEGSHLVEQNVILNTALAGLIRVERRSGWLRKRRGVSLMLTAQKPSG